MHKILRAFTKLLPDKLFLTIKYRIKFGKRLNWKTPTTFNEKLQWLKIYARDPLYPSLVDKYAVRKYVAEKIGEEYLIPLLGVWDTVDAIDFDTLPEQFVLKCTHDCGSIVICRDKKKFDVAAAKKKLSAAQKVNYYWGEREWPYQQIRPRIIAEQLLADRAGKGLMDYKLFCFDGIMKLMLITTDRYVNGKEVKFDFFDVDFKHLPIKNGHEHAAVIPECPLSFVQMKALSEKLSSGLPHARVDFYDIDGKIYFGELTLFHFGGFVKFEPEEWDKTLGDWIVLPPKRRRTHEKSIDSHHHTVWRRS